jgi:hypothetical protein
MLCQSYYYFGYSHLNQPLKAYSCGNFGFFEVPTIERTSFVSGSLYNGFETTLYVSYSGKKSFGCFF